MNVFNKPEIADVYDDYYQTSTGKKVNKIEERLIGDALSQISNDKMLELGCGTGHWTSFFLNQGFEIVATDISEAMLKIARQKNLHTEILKANAENLPFEKNSFPIVSSITMLEFVNNRNKVLQEMYRVLKPNGWLLLGCLNGNSQLAKNAVHDPVFKNASFLTPDVLNNNLTKFGTPKITSGVYFSSTFELLDGTPEQDNWEPAFLAGLVQKRK